MIAVPVVVLEDFKAAQQPWASAAFRCARPAGRGRAAVLAAGRRVCALQGLASRGFPAARWVLPGMLHRVPINPATRCSMACVSIGVGIDLVVSSCLWPVTAADVVREHAQQALYGLEGLARGVAASQAGAGGAAAVTPHSQRALGALSSSSSSANDSGAGAGKGSASDDCEAAAAYEERVQADAEASAAAATAERQHLQRQAQKVSGRVSVGTTVAAGPAPCVPGQSGQLPSGAA